MSEYLLKLSQRSDVRLAGFGLSSVAAVYLGFLELDTRLAGIVVTKYGYYFVLAAFALWVFALWRLWQRRTAPGSLSRGEVLFAVLAIGLLCLVAICAEPFRSKVLYDEFALQSTAYSMHYFRETSMMVRGYDILGVFLPVTSFLDKRPNFYPFLVSLVHDLTGYRPANAYWLNAVLLPVTLGLAYYIGRRLNGARGGLLAVLLLGSLPLLGQSATGSSMELLNIAMLLAVVALAAAYLGQPDETRLSALVLAVVLLAQTRYESAIYVVPVAFIIVLGWWRVRRIILSWMAVLAPLLLLPSALQNKVLTNTPSMWELKDNQETRFSLDYLAGNLRGAGDFFFNTSARLANSWPLTVLGFLALGYVLWRLFRARPPAGANPDHAALFLLGLGMVANTILIMFYYWSNLADPIASRFSLPFHLVLTFAVVAVATRLDRRIPASLTLVAGMTVFSLGVTTSHAAQHIYSHLGIDEVEWEKRYVAALPPGERLIITNKSTLPWLMLKTPSILTSRARLIGERLKYQIESGHTFWEILVLQSLRPTTVDGDHQLLPEDRLPPGYTLELIAEKRFGTKLARISRLVAVDLPADYVPLGVRVIAPNQRSGESQVGN